MWILYDPIVSVYRVNYVSFSCSYVWLKLCEFVYTNCTVYNRIESFLSYFGSVPGQLCMRAWVSDAVARKALSDTKTPKCFVEPCRARWPVPDGDRRWGEDQQLQTGECPTGCFQHGYFSISTRGLCRLLLSRFLSQMWHPKSKRIGQIHHQCLFLFINKRC